MHTGLVLCLVPLITALCTLTAGGHCAAVSQLHSRGSCAPVCAGASHFLRNNKHQGNRSIPPLLSVLAHLPTKSHEALLQSTSKPHTCTQPLSSAICRRAANALSLGSARSKDNFRGQARSKNHTAFHFSMAACLLQKHDVTAAAEARPRARRPFMCWSRQRLHSQEYNCQYARTLS